MGNNILQYICPALTPQYDLLVESLKTKWYMGSEKKLNDECPFCTNARQIKEFLKIDKRFQKENKKNPKYKENKEWACYFCQCPKEICGVHDQKHDIMDDLVIKYGLETQICSLEKEDLNRIIAAFQKRIDVIKSDPWFQLSNIS